jgi:hypothetical protein
LHVIDGIFTDIDGAQYEKTQVYGCTLGFTSTSPARLALNKEEFDNIDKEISTHVVSAQYKSPVHGLITRHSKI